MKEAVLEEIGLTKGEAKVYLTLLRLGETTTGKIVEGAQISSGKIYEILNKLMQKGLVSYIIKDKTRYFVAASPNRILDYMQEKERDLQTKKHDLLKELPALLAFEKGKKEYETTLFRGLKGIQTAIFELLPELSQSDEVLAFGVRSSKAENFNVMWKRWHVERIRRKIPCRMIFSDKDADYSKAFKKMRFTEARILKGISPSAIDIMKNYVLIVSYGEEPSCLVIKNPEIAQSFRDFFFNLWNISE